MMEFFPIALTADLHVVTEEEELVGMVAAVQEFPARPFWYSL
jgi:hypothetical protein